MDGIVLTELILLAALRNANGKTSQSSCGRMIIPNSKYRAQETLRWTSLTLRMVQASTKADRWEDRLIIGDTAQVCYPIWTHASEGAWGEGEHRHTCCC